MSEAMKSPYLIDWAITASCNLSCRHCRGFPLAELATVRARTLIPEIARLKPGWVIVEGGEPLLRGDIFALLDLMRQNGLDVHLVTNGMLLTPQNVTVLKGLGVKVMVSLDGATQETYERLRAGASYARVLQAIRSYAKAGLLEALNFTILKSNYREIPALFELAAARGAAKINLIGLKPCDRYEEERLTPALYREAVGLTCRAAGKTGVGFFFDEPFFNVTAGELGLPVPAPAGEAGILATATPACIFGEYLFIEVNGDVKPCSFAPLVLGNVTEKPLGEVWQSMPADPFLARIRDATTRTGACRECRYLADCKGCRSRTRVLTGDWFAADPACPLTAK